MGPNFILIYSLTLICSNCSLLYFFNLRSGSPTSFFFVSLLNFALPGKKERLIAGHISLKLIFFKIIVMGTVNKLSTIFSFSTFFLTFNFGLLPNKLIKTGWPGQTSQVVTRIPLLIRTIQPDQFISKHYVPAVTGFSKRFYQRLTFPFQNAGSGQPVLTFAKHPY